MQEAECAPEFCGRTQSTVGVSLLAKAAFGPLKMCRMYQPLREQAHSYRRLSTPRNSVAEHNQL
uniref:Uncharacterized protein n=1 Tax=Pseudomonas graminis TaxID=158627 RepID=A0A7C1WSM6_9PSED